MEHPFTMQTEIWPRSRFQLLFGKRPARMPQFVWRRIYLLRLVGNTMMAAVLLYPVALLATYSGFIDETILKGLGQR